MGGDEENYTIVEPDRIVRIYFFQQNIEPFEVFLIYKIKYKSVVIL